MNNMNNSAQHDHSLKKIHFQIHSNEYYFKTYYSIYFIRGFWRKQSDNLTPASTDGLSCGNCALHNSFRQTFVYINGPLVSTSNNLSNYASDIQFILITPSPIRKNGLTMGYDYRSNVDTDGELTWEISKQYHFVGKLNNEIFDKFQWMSPNVKIGGKQQITPSHSILRKIHDPSPDSTVNLTSSTLDVQKQYVMNYIASIVEKLRASWNNVKLLFPHKITNQQHITTIWSTFKDSSFINVQIPSKLFLIFVKSAVSTGSWTSSPCEF